jgi:hypothetical protein
VPGRRSQGVHRCRRLDSRGGQPEALTRGAMTEASSGGCGSSVPRPGESALYSLELSAAAVPYRRWRLPGAFVWYSHQLGVNL